jgi:hypothetical protein
MEAVAVAFSMAWVEAGAGSDGKDRALRRLAGFRDEVYRCLTRRGDALFELADAVLCAPGRVTDLARLSLAAEFRRGHGGLYDGLNAGRAEIGRLRRAVAGLPLPAWPDGQIRLGADVCNWLRPDAETSGERLFCAVHGRGKNSKQMIPGWPYSFVAVLGPGRSSWTLPLDAVRLRPHDDETEVTAAQLREVVARLIEAGRWKQGDPPVLIMMDSGYSGTRLAWLLADLPVTLAVRVRPDRVFYRPAPDRAPGTRGRTLRHDDPVKCADAATWTSPDLETDAESARHGPLAVMAWARVHQRIHRGCGGWDDWPPHREYPLIEGTLIRLAVTAPGRAGLEPMWLWASDPGAGLDADAAAVLWQAYLRRFDLEHMFRFLKSQLGWDKPMLRDPAAADRWTWLIIACYAQLWLARDLTADIRLPWQRPHPGTAGSRPMTPGRVRAGFRVVRQNAGTPASAGKYTRPGPGRPAGSRNKRKAPLRHVGKTILRQHSIDDSQRKQARRTNEQAG